MFFSEDRYYLDLEQLTNQVLDTYEKENRYFTYYPCHPIYFKDSLPHTFFFKNLLHRDGFLDLPDLLHSLLEDYLSNAEEDYTPTLKAVGTTSSLLSIVQFVWRYFGIFLSPVAKLAIILFGFNNQHILTWEPDFQNPQKISLQEMLPDCENCPKNV